MLFPVWLSHVSRACTALSKHGVGVEPPFWPDFWDRGRACARGGGGEAQCARIVTIWASRRTRNPYFVVLGASLLFDNKYFGASFTLDMAFWGFHSIFFSSFTHFHPLHVLLSRLISPHYGSSQCGHSASASTFVDSHLAPDATVKVKINMQMTSMQMKIND